MKNRRLTLILAVLILVTVFLSGCDKPKPVGEWLCDTRKDAIVFHGNGTLEYLYYGFDQRPPPPGGNDAINIPGTGKYRLRYQGTYTVDFKKNPAWMDWVIPIQGSPRRVQMLIKFLDDNTFYLGTGGPGGNDVRPATIETAVSGTRWTRAAPNELKR